MQGVLAPLTHTSYVWCSAGHFRVCLSSASASIDLQYLRSLEHLTAEQTFYKQILEALFDAVEKTARDPNLPAGCQGRFCDPEELRDVLQQLTGAARGSITVL